VTKMSYEWKKVYNVQEFKDRIKFINSIDLDYEINTFMQKFEKIIKENFPFEIPLKITYSCNTYGITIVYTPEEIHIGMDNTEIYDWCMKSPNTNCDYETHMSFIVENKAVLNSAYFGDTKFIIIGKFYLGFYLNEEDEKTLEDLGFIDEEYVEPSPYTNKSIICRI